MCGIAGIIYKSPEEPVSEVELGNMLGAISHRGPDGSGTWVKDGVGLGHVRLSIIDLGGGRQPMCNEDGTVWVTFNGEIYNFKELRDDLERKGHVFKTHSDTEVIIHLFEEYDIHCLERLRGMFAFAAFDSKRNRTLLVRDRLGIKPVYYFEDSKRLIFGSEIKAIISCESVPRRIEEESISSFWACNYLPGELTMFRGIKKLLPGHYILINNGKPENPKPYWDLNVSPSVEYTSLESAADILLNLLRETSRMHMMSDVPVGFLLSGGMDSSAVLRLATEGYDRKAFSYTVGFSEKGVIDERPFARLMSEQCGTEHSETEFASDRFWSFLPELMWHLEEPICEPPAAALHFVTQRAREDVKVLLSGEGGDEAFGGYSNYPNQLKLNTIRDHLGKGLCKGIGSIAQLVDNGISGSNKFIKYAALLHKAPREYYWSRVGNPPSCKEVGLKPALYAGEFFRELFRRVQNASLLQQLLYIDTKSWLPDDLLIKADKVTMAHSLELRVPLLDHKVVEFAATLPDEFKVHNNGIKRILKSAFRDLLPAPIRERRKVGFPVPYARWLAADCFKELEDVVLGRGSFTTQVMSKSAARQILSEHRARRSRQRDVFSLVALELWSQKWLS